MPVNEATYELKKGPVPTLWADYLLDAGGRWKRLLESDPSERQVQHFLEENPSFVPGAWTPPPIKTGHIPFPSALITQPKLPGFNSRQPDFMWISTHSSEWFPTLIEIERPEKKLFRADGIPTSEFNQARNQLAQWRTWFSEPTNMEVFVREYGIPDYMARGRQIRLHMLLVYGRRAEYDANRHLSKHRASLLSGSDEHLMSFDRIAPDRDSELFITVRAEGGGRFEVVHVPETFGINCFQICGLLKFSGLAEAIDRSPRISPARKAFLKERLHYWKDWCSRAKGLKRSPEFIE